MPLDINWHSWQDQDITAQFTNEDSLGPAILHIKVKDETAITIFGRHGEEEPSYGLTTEQLRRIAEVINNEAAPQEGNVG